MCYGNQNPHSADDENEGISAGIIFVNEDVAYENSLSEVLRGRHYCNYTHHPSFTFRVVRTKSVADALREIFENKERLDLVITNLHKLHTVGFEAIQIINQNLNVSLIPSKERIEQEEELLSFSVYFVNGLNSNGLKNLLGNAKGVGTTAKDEQQINTSIVEGAAAATAPFAPINANANANAAANAAAVVTINTGVEHVERALLPNPNPNAAAAAAAVVETYEASPSPSPSPSPSQKGKRRRVSWTDDMHKKFLNAIETLGEDNAFPMKIVKAMGVEGLTRENVASHLQKHRQQRSFRSKSSKRIHWSSSSSAAVAGLTTNTSPEPDQPEPEPEPAAASFVSSNPMGGPPTLSQQSALMLDPWLPENVFPMHLLGETGGYHHEFFHHISPLYLQPPPPE